MSIVGRKGPISVSQIMNEIRSENPEHGGRYVEAILRKLAPRDSMIVVKRLFSWDDLLSNPQETKKKVKNLYKS